MFYVQKSQRRYRGLAIIHLGPSLVVFIAFMGLTLWSWSDARNNLAEQKTQVVAREVEQAKSTIQTRLSGYEDLLRAGEGLLGASQEVTPQEWKQFISVFDLQNRYPGVSGVGYGQVVTQEQAPEFIEKMRAYGATDFTISPAGVRPIYVPITYVQTPTPTPVSLGFDIYSEESRRQAMNTARDTGSAAMTQPVQLIRDQLDNNPQPGFNIYLPIYSGGATPPTQDGRRQQIRGFVYASFRSQNLLSQILPTNEPHVAVKVVHGDKDNATTLYQSNNYPAVESAQSVQTYTEAVIVNDKQWTVVGIADVQALPSRDINRPSAVLWGGLMFSTFVAGFIYLFLANRTKTLAQKDEEEIREAKDELLALASHQLRTPATGVKQYIGMLREGYAGELTEEQRLYLEKAHASNERQLGTINEMLVVARADADHLQIKKTNIELNELVKDVIEELLPAINERNQTLNSYMPSKPVHIHADRQYVRMAIENIVNNATKYTPDNGTITVTLLQKKGSIHLIVRDSGVGVSKGDYPLLFQKFSRIPNELTSKVGGSGIGLYLAQKIIDAHGGKITFDSMPEAGSVCTIILPVRNKDKPRRL